MMRYTTRPWKAEMMVLMPTYRWIWSSTLARRLPGACAEASASR